MAVSPPSASRIASFRSMKTEADVATFLGVTVNALRYLLYSKRRPIYKRFALIKKSGGMRTINVPPPQIAKFQTRILGCLTSMAPPKAPCHGFAVGRSVVSNAKSHVGKNLVLNFDIKDFFPSINFGRVRGVFGKHPFNFPPPVATILAHICCAFAVLPQGAPTSPIISNLICRGLDNDLSRLARRHRCTYTRYADDITFSTSGAQFEPAIVASLPVGISRSPTLGVELAAVILKHQLTINPDKTRLQLRSERQEVTGLVVNQKLNVPRHYVRNLRSILHDIESKGIAAAEARFLTQFDSKNRVGGAPLFSSHVRGRVEYLRAIKGGDDPVYLQLAIRAANCFDNQRWSVPTYGRCAEQKFWEMAIWVIRAINADGIEVSQGTAFALYRTGLVSAAHVFRDLASTPDLTWEARCASDIHRVVRITGVQIHAHLDMALVHIASLGVTCFSPSADPLVANTEINALGFPSWNTVADRLAIASGRVIQVRPVRGVTEISTSAHVRGGMSGGPLLTSDGKVVGVILRDSSSPLTPNGGNHIRHISDVANEPIQAV